MGRAVVTLGPNCGETTNEDGSPAMSGWTHKTRALVVMTAVSLAFSAVGYRLFSLHVLRHAELSALAAANREIVVHRQGRRGEILDTNGNLLANSQSVRIVTADPSVATPTASIIAQKLAPLLQMDEAALVLKLNGQGRYVRLRTKVDEDTVQRIRALKLKGIGFED